MMMMMIEEWWMEWNEWIEWTNEWRKWNDWMNELCEWMNEENEMIGWMNCMINVWIGIAFADVSACVKEEEPRVNFYGYYTAQTVWFTSTSVVVCWFVLFFAFIFDIIKSWMNWWWLWLICLLCCWKGCEASSTCCCLSGSTVIGEAYDADDEFDFVTYIPSFPSPFCPSPALVFFFFLLIICLFSSSFRICAV